MASTYLTRTPSSAGNRKTFTISAWIKRGTISSANSQIISSGAYGSLQLFQTFFESDDTIYISDYTSSGSKSFQLTTNRKLRDINCWYHILFAVDTTQATTSNRVKVYINGVQETSFSEANYPSQNFDCALNLNQLHTIANRSGSNFQFGGSMSHFHLCDGTALAPTVFGSTDSTTGEWKINTSPSFTPGTNGFTILKDGNTITDQSANSNNWSLGAGTLTKTEDCPSNVFATMNPLIPGTTNYTYSNGNNTVSQSGQSWVKTCSTLGMTSGKYYWEAKWVSGNYAVIGVGNTTTATAASGMPANGIGYKRNGEVQRLGSVTNIGTYTTGDIISCYLDMDNEALYYAKNGVMLNSGVPTSGASKTGAFTMPVANSTYFATISIYDGSGGAISMNFGNGYFGTTAVSSAGSNASGIGIFEYDVPTGYTALSTKGLNL